jgi:hypothetical protein
LGRNQLLIALDVFADQIQRDMESLEFSVNRVFTDILSRDAKILGAQHERRAADHSW